MLPHMENNHPIRYTPAAVIGGGGSAMAHMVFPDADKLADICRRYQIKTLALFGSRLKGTHRQDSDFDLLVEFEPDARPTLFDVCAAEIEFSELLGGQKVDLRTAEDLSRYFRDEVVKTAEVQYAA